MKQKGIKFDTKLEKDIIAHIKNNKLKYRSFSHFVLIACIEQLKRDKNEL